MLNERIHSCLLMRSPVASYHQAMIYAIAVRSSSFTDTSEARCLTNSWGAEKNGEWLVSIDMTLWHGRDVYLGSRG